MFKKAIKEAAFLRMSIAGPSGSGKSWTALTFAAALSPSGKIAVVDTEHGSASKYANDFSFDAMELNNFHPKNYVEAIEAAVAGGYEVVILDSISHAWNGKGGLLAIVGGRFDKWKEVAPIEQAFIEAMIGNPIHVIATMRSKTQYEMDKDERTGKSTPRKVGMGAIQREGMEYEMDIALTMDLQNTLTVEKTRCPAIRDMTANRPDGKFMRPIIEWLKGGAPAPVQKPPPPQTAAKTNGATPPPAQTADVDMGMGGASPYKYADLIDRLSGTCATLATKMREVHAQSSSLASDAQYQYLAGVVDAIVDKKGAHNAILEVVVGRPVTGENPCGKGLASKLLDYLVATKKVDDTEVANPNYREDVANCVKTIWSLVLEVDGQLRLIEA